MARVYSGILGKIHAKLLYPQARVKGIISLFAWSPEWKRSIPLEFEQRAAEIPDHPCVRFEGRVWTYEEANRTINRHAHAYAAMGISKGDVVALMMDNRPEFLWHLYGIAKIGAIASLINTEARGKPLSHAITSCAAKFVTVADRYHEAIKEVEPDLAGLGDKIEAVPDTGKALIGECPYPDFNRRLEGMSEDNPTTTAEISMSDTIAYIYTSGTTGLPKPAIVKHHRFWRAGRGFGGIAFGMTPYDNLYLFLPLYHSNASLIGTSVAIMWGATMTIGRKFSATRFWDEIRENNCTGFIYIGEVLRYLLNQPPKANDADNPVKNIEGNGLRPEIWEEFKNRFGIKRINEHYAATEGNVESINSLGVVGAMGPLLPWKMRIAKWDAENQDFVRDANGRLVKAGFDEPGVMLGKILPKNEYVGYTNKEQSNSKILRNAFKEGDAWYNTGDMIKVGKNMHLYFVDRLGDTFRWKGQNVSTQEVATEINGLSWVSETTVIGVQIPGNEGRVGMASVVLTDGKEFDGHAFYQHVTSKLANYAQPAFVRVKPALETTVTFKHDKKTLMKEGYDPNVVADPLFVRDDEGGTYRPLTKDVFHEVQQNQIPF